jgi:4-amino-4-deoxy-L-arabinose transferase-like glycosyltransferase
MGTRLGDNRRAFSNRYYELIVVFVAALIFGVGAESPPSLMDDVDAVQAQIARTMLDSGDWVTARLDGVAYLEKAPLKYWMMAASMAVFGVHDWAARIPLALSTIALCWLVVRMGTWAFSPREGFLAGLVLSTCVGLWLFTRILIPDVVLTLTIALALYGFLRGWAYLFWACLGVGFLLKGLIAMVFPVGAVLLFWAFSGEWREWRKLKPFTGMLLTLAIAAPWVVLATLRNPPYFDFTMHSTAGEYHGFLWFFFLNEHVFRFLNMRHPRDYNTVPRVAFWLFHFLWLFPWSVWLPSAIRRPKDRMSLLCLCWIGFLLVFFTFSTTQEYYSMPCYPALALLLGRTAETKWPARVLRAVCGSVAVLLFTMFVLTRGYPAPGDISQALTLNPDAYTLSLGHMRDLTLPAMAYLRTPLLIAAVAFGMGAAIRQRAIALTLMMVLFTFAARQALVVFDPYLSSRPFAEALLRAPKGEVIFDNQYYTFSSVFFYANTRGWLLNGRVNNLEYGSYAPGAPQVFLDDAEFAERWRRPELHYLLVEGPSVPRIEGLVGKAAMHVVKTSGGKFLFANRLVQ